MSRVAVNDVHISRGDREILRRISFEHSRGRILTFLGPSGCGKTTLLWLLAKLLEPARGTIQYDGGPALAVPNFGMVFQDGALWEHLTVQRHLDIVLRGRSLSRDVRSKRITDMLDRTRLAGLADRRPGELSGGERQRLAIARALVVEPNWLFLDEPTSQLDGPARQELIELLAEQIRATSAGIFLATHQVDLAMRLSDELAILHDGVIIQQASPADIYHRPGSLHVARLLGPASEISANAIVGVPQELQGTRLILRPQQLQFVADDIGNARVLSCHFAGGFWQVEVDCFDGQRALASSPTRVDLSTRGSLHWRSG